MRDGMITEEQCGENFAYILEDKTDFLITEYKMMHGQEADFLLKCVKMLYNGKTELYYDTKSCLPLAIQSGAEDTEGMLSVLGNILHEVRRVTENGFLSLLIFRQIRYGSILQREKSGSYIFLWRRDFIKM